MKKHYFLFMLIVATFSELHSYQNIMSYFIDQPISAIQTNKVILRHVLDSAVYTEKGVTFNYAEGTFSDIPHVMLVVELNGLFYAENVAFVPIVVENSNLLTTVKVNVLEGLNISEAKAGSIIIHLCAIGLG